MEGEEGESGMMEVGWAGWSLSCFSNLELYSILKKFKREKVHEVKRDKRAVR